MILLSVERKALYKFNCGTKRNEFIGFPFQYIRKTKLRICIQWAQIIFPVFLTSIIVRYMDMRMRNRKICSLKILLRTPPFADDVKLMCFVLSIGIQSNIALSTLTCDLSISFLQKIFSLKQLIELRLKYCHRWV